MNRAAGGAARSPTDVDGWAADAFAVLGAVPEVVRVGLALVEGGGRQLRFTASERRSGSDLGWCHVDAYDDVPLNSAVRTGEPVIGALEDLSDRYADFVDHQRGTRHAAVAAVPVVGARVVLGGYVLFFDHSQPFDRRQRTELIRLGHQLGGSLRAAHRRAERQPTATWPDVPTSPDALVAVHEVAAELAAVAEARHVLQQTLAGWGVVRDAIETAALCLSELVTNAVIHSHGGCVVRLVLHDGILTAWVRDSGIAGAVPLESSGDPLEVHGRGLQLVEALASSWGHDTDPDGASVWFSLAIG